MNELSREGSRLTIGVDLGDKYSQLCVLDEQGEICEEGRVPTTARAMRKRFEGMASCRVVIEVGSHSPWVQRLLEELGHERYGHPGGQLPAATNHESSPWPASPRFFRQAQPSPALPDRPLSDRSMHRGLETPRPWSANRSSAS
jgi:hypothetical protein